MKDRKKPPHIRNTGIIQGGNHQNALGLFDELEGSLAIGFSPINYDKVVGLLHEGEKFFKTFRFYLRGPKDSGGGRQNGETQGMFEEDILQRSRIDPENIFGELSPIGRGFYV